MVQYTRGCRLRQYLGGMIGYIRGPGNGLTKIIDKGGASPMRGMSTVEKKICCIFTRKCVAGDLTDCSVTKIVLGVTRGV